MLSHPPTLPTVTALLTICQVDFHEVASYFQIKAPAARMRLMRLRQALEAESNREGFREKDRKRRLNPFKAKDKLYNHDGEDDDDEALDDVPLMQRLQARLMRIKREEGLMIKNEDGTLIKDEDSAMIKNEDDGFWGKKEEDVDEQEEEGKVDAGTRGSGGVSYFKSEANESRVDLQNQVTHMDMEGAVKPGNFSSPSSQHTAPHLGPSKMEIDPKPRDYGYGSDQHASTHLANLRTYGHANTSSPYVHERNDNFKPEHVKNNHFSTPFHSYNSLPRTDVFNSFASVKPESAYGNTRVTPPSAHDSSFRLDMFNAALTNPVTPGVETEPARQQYVDSVVGSPVVKDYPSPLIARQSYQNNNFE